MRLTLDERLDGFQGGPGRLYWAIQVRHCAGTSDWHSKLRRWKLVLLLAHWCFAGTSASTFAFPFIAKVKMNYSVTSEAKRWAHSKEKGNCPTIYFGIKKKSKKWTKRQKLKMGVTILSERDWLSLPPQISKTKIGLMPTQKTVPDKTNYGKNEQRTWRKRTKKKAFASEG